MRLHREDPRTTHNCAGRLVDKAIFIEDVTALMRERHGGGHLLVS